MGVISAIGQRSSSWISGTSAPKRWESSRRQSKGSRSDSFLTPSIMGISGRRGPWDIWALESIQFTPI